MVRYDGVLQRGIQSSAVAAVQRELIRRGYRQLDGQILQADGGFGPVTEALVMAFQAQHTDASGRPLVVDGVIGPVTWAALFGTATVTVKTAPPNAFLGSVVAEAARQVGVRERPIGSNDGPEVRRFLAAVDLGPGAPWCAAFVCWVLVQAAELAGRKLKLPMSGSCAVLWQHGCKAGLAWPSLVIANAERSVIPGFLFFVAGAGRPCHVGFVEDCAAGILNTIEGNTNEGGSREGVGVFRRERKLASVLGLMEPR